MKEKNPRPYYWKTRRHRGFWLLPQRHGRGFKFGPYFQDHHDMKILLLYFGPYRAEVIWTDR